MIRGFEKESNRHSTGIPYITQELSSIIEDIEKESCDPSLAQSLYFSPTALTHIRRLVEMGGTIVTDTTLVATGIDSSLLGNKNATVNCLLMIPR